MGGITVTQRLNMAVILKFFKWHLLQNGKSVWFKTWWEASQWHKDSELLKSFHSLYSGHLEILQMSSPPKRLDRAKTWWEASQWHRDSEFLKSFRSDISWQPSWNSSTTSPKPQVRLSRNLMGGITVTQRFRIAKIVPLWYPRWPSWNSSNDSSQTTSQIEPKHGRHWSFRIAKIVPFWYPRWLP